MPPPKVSKLTLACDIHRIHQAHRSAFNLASAEVSGMISTSLAQHGIGTLKTFRDILATLFEHRLVIHYDDPPPDAHRQAVYDLYLPIEGADTEQASVGHLSRLKRRYILARTLNGRIDGAEVQHFCGVGCCSSRAETMFKFKEFTTAALLPGKMPRFAKNRWNNQFASAAWGGLLASHHNLLVPLLLAFTGGPVSGRSVAASNEERNSVFFEALADEMEMQGSASQAGDSGVTVLGLFFKS